MEPAGRYQAGIESDQESFRDLVLSRVEVRAKAKLMKRALLVVGLMGLLAGCASRGGFRIYSSVSGNNEQVALGYARQVTALVGGVRYMTFGGGDGVGVIAPWQELIKDTYPPAVPTELRFRQERLRPEAEADGLVISLLPKEKFKAEAIPDDASYAQELQAWRSSVLPRNKFGQVILQKPEAFSWKEAQGIPRP